MFYEIKKDIYSVLYIKECTSDILCFRKIVSLTILFGNSKVEALKCEIGRLWSRHLTLVFKYEEYKQYAVLAGIRTDVIDFPISCFLNLLDTLYF